MRKEVKGTEKSHISTSSDRRRRSTRDFFDIGNLYGDDALVRIAEARTRTDAETHW